MSLNFSSTVIERVRYILNSYGNFLVDKLIKPWFFFIIKQACARQKYQQHCVQFYMYDV